MTPGRVVWLKNKSSCLSFKSSIWSAAESHVLILDVKLSLMSNLHYLASVHKHSTFFKWHIYMLTVLNEMASDFWITLYWLICLRDKNYWVSYLLLNLTFDQPKKTPTSFDKSKGFENYRCHCRKARIRQLLSNKHQLGISLLHHTSHIIV